MTCDLVRNKLDAYADESLSPEDRAAVEEHVAHCSTCAAEIVARLQNKRATRLAAANLAQSAAFRMRPEFRQRIENDVLKSRRPFWSRPRSLRLAAVSIAVILAVASVIMLTRPAARNQDLAELLDVHIATLASANPVDVVSTDRHTVKPWFQGKLPFTFNLPELEGSPYKLLGGKLIYFEQKPGAQLLFELHKHQLSVFITQDDPGILARLATIDSKSERGFSTETWLQSGLRYVVVGDANAADVHALGDLLRGAGR